VKVLRQSGYTVKDACQALGISRGAYYYALKDRKLKVREGDDVRDEELLRKIKVLKSDHPFWGYRRVWAWLKFRGGMRVNQKRIRRVMKEHGLTVSQRIHKARRTPQRRKPRAERPLEYWGIDATKFMIPSVGWVYLVIVLDWFSKKIVG